MYIYVWRDKHVLRSLKNYQQHENNGQNSKVRFPRFLHRNGRHLGRVARGKKIYMPSKILRWEHHFSPYILGSPLIWSLYFGSSQFDPCYF